MRLVWLGHAALLVRAGGEQLLCDPWLAEPVFARAWWRYPPPPYPTAESLGRVDRLLLSHAHPDHSGEGTLACLDAATPTYALPFPSNQLARRLARAGYRAVRWLEPWQPVEIGAGVRITMVPHDGGWEVASMLVEADGVRVYHGNDNPLEVATYEEIVRRLGPVDVAFLPFAGASSYPTCFSWEPGVMQQKAAAKKAEGVGRFTDGVRGLRPRVAVPFASSWALLEPRDLWRNFYDRPTAAEAAAAAADVAREVGTAVVVMEPGDEWSPEEGHVARRLTAGWTYDVAGVTRYASQEKARVEAAARARDRHGALPPTAALEPAFRTYFGAMLEATRDATKALEMRAAFHADGPEGTAARFWIRFSPGQPPVLGEGAPDAVADETFTVTLPELWDVLAGPVRFEDLWYGYRLRVRKRAGAGYYRAFWDMLLNWDDEATSADLATQLVGR